MIPTDDELIDCLRTGCKNIPEIIFRLHGLDGSGPVDNYLEYKRRKNSYNHRLNKLIRQGIVRKVGMIDGGRNHTRCMGYEVIE